MANPVIQYVRDSFEEMKKVTWPTKNEVRIYTIQVIAISLGVAAFLGGLDMLFSRIIENLV